jgi:hypothetical protein
MTRPRRRQRRWNRCIAAGVVGFWAIVVVLLVWLSGWRP